LDAEKAARLKKNPTEALGTTDVGGGEQGKPTTRAKKKKKVGKRGVKCLLSHQGPMNASPEIFSRVINKLSQGRPAGFRETKEKKRGSPESNAQQGLS